MNTKDMEIIFSNQDIQDIQSRNNKLIERLLGQSFASNIETSFNNLNSAVLSLHSSFVTDQSSFHKSTEHLNKLKRHRYEVMCLTDNLKPIIAHKEKSRKLYSVNAINCYLLEPELELSLILTEKGCNDVKIMVNVRYLADNTLLSQENNKFLDLIKEYEFFADRDIINQVENGKKFDPYDYNSLVSIGEAKPYCPPFSIILTDIMKNWNYYFSVRIKFLDNGASIFSKIKKICIV